MPQHITCHYDNGARFTTPHLWVWYPGSSGQRDLAPRGQDRFGFVYEIPVRRGLFRFKFKQGPGVTGPWEGPSLDREYRPLLRDGQRTVPTEIWCRSDKAFVYDVEPRAAELMSAKAFLQGLSFPPGLYVPATGSLSGLGANRLADGRVLFGLYHPNAAQVYVMGSFNDWQRPGHQQPDPSRFIEMKLYRGYFDTPNTWLVVTDQAGVDAQYRFFVQGGVPANPKGRFQRYVIDPYARRLDDDFRYNNAAVVDPTFFSWTDADWTTPDMADLILYEMSVHGFTEGDPDVQPKNQGKFAGITERIEAGYFDRLGITALSLMPLAEASSMQGPQTLGYNSSAFFATERDFGRPDDLRQLVDTAHQHGLAVLLDQVFNHTDNDFNPLWEMILEHPGDASNPQAGGLYFSGASPWGNRVATEKIDVQNMLIDACKLLLLEYHVDGFRFDATHTYYMDHGFLHRLAKELKEMKPDVLLVAENLPNQPGLNRQGFDGYAQWCNQFHDKIKALLREGPFEGQFDNPDHLADAFYFSKRKFASHTNNVVNYCESHDEHSVPYEIHYTPWLNHPPTKRRKGRLGLFSTMVALGQPMIYMGQEFNEDRRRNLVTVDWPSDLDRHEYFKWACRLMHLRKRYRGLRLSGYNPAETGQFSWILGPWMPVNRGGGRKIIGWRSNVDSSPQNAMLVMLNFENRGVPVDVDFGTAGVWLKLADVDRVNDLPPHGTNSVQDAAAVRTVDGHFADFVLPSSSAFIYKWHAPM